ncbi:U11/U12 small nuclear ribonucleoprotein 65 kDa protein isoform X1 [Lycium barbarum]|uniref:U11/U12 small nuclear ribonucleoprotein 65 kDa protein isoform X1 n=1 Tax=Lycium barbarum TaxID=112863 RepID=UPI00293F57FF|nr:U11/U12 small nuclear ribonucleoprotein 65 kDa protein isoform X1 [Lycium barbarum]XP_060168547.1 U11/U12 small nuclear ribonucleoprotein 65 kDa protein isoform X1 [Lycium barbarum]XP_060168548.1 U11/U12 small nuclear ribonucleoprotein 65 kDa protein isoform X1 [Lycium barbarum]XP_060168549.1 U11/U12 small nuclear ribonucleoprotein 65 kDa protein isoform X1 [Lycium barbarum]XP_060168550.1 U11/U12 small nuclear ribonucleoprotein 65 kDa protein isoform X1 [Lycium barbarum]XP_060168552.1 U11/U
MDAYMTGNPVPQPAYHWPMEGVKESTLLIRHLPEAIPHETLSRLLSNYGATSIRPCTSGRMRNCAFVDFKDEGLAHQAQQHLNGVRFLGKTLAVERASRSTERDKYGQSEPRIGNESVSLIQDAAAKEFGGGSRAGPYPVSEPIAERLGVDYPFPPHLEYVYPPPDGHILTNIVNALIAVPRFYTQVLHLMNKMNIPAPFRMALPTPPLPTSPSVPPPPPPLPPPTVSKSRMEDQSSSESEMESSDEEASKVGGPKQKRIRHEAILGPAVDKDVAHEAVGLRAAALVPKEMPVVKKKNPIIQIKVAPKQVQNEEKDDASAMPLVVEDKENDHKPFTTLEELRSGRLPPEEILSLPMFKNYCAGNPSQILYLKNLAKEVNVDDIYFIFGSLFGSIDEAKSSLAVKLMQEGRMRGQAFVTFPSVELAENALNLVNGYVFKGKPIVIQFGRDPAKAKTR